MKPALCIKVMQKLLQYNYTLLFKVTGSQILSQHALGKRQENTVDGTSLKQACNHQHVGLRCLKMSAHDHTRHVLSGRLFGCSTDGTGISLLLITKLALSRVAHPSTGATEFRKPQWCSSVSELFKYLEL